MSKYLLDDEKLTSIYSGDETILKELFLSCQVEFVSYVRKRFGLDQRQAENLYADSFVQFYLNVRDEKLKPPLQSKLSTYIIGIGKLMYLKKFRGRYQEKTVLIEQKEFADMVPDFRPDMTDYKTMAEHMLEKLGGRCAELLRLLFIKEYSFEAARSTLGFPTEGAVRKAKYDCLKKMRSLIDTDEIRKILWE